MERLDSHSNHSISYPSELRICRTDDSLRSVAYKWRGGSRGSRRRISFGSRTHWQGHGRLFRRVDRDACHGGSAGAETSPLAITEGYSLFTNNGVKVRSTPLSAVYRDGVKLNLPNDSPVRLSDPGPAYVVTQMMRSVLSPRGTASGALSMSGLSSDAQTSAKTGTGQVNIAAEGGQQIKCYLIQFLKLT